MKKRMMILLTFCVILGGCASGDKGGTSPEITTLEGNWEQNEKSDSYHAGYISGDVIEIFWVSDGGETRSLYWSGTYNGPEKLEDGYSWDSVNNKEKTNVSMLASEDDTKTFTYKNGEITYSASALGTTKTVHLVPTDTDYSDGHVGVGMPAEESQQMGEVTEAEGAETENPPEMPEENGEESKNNEIEVLADYTLSDSIGWYTYRYMILRNNSSNTVDVSTSSLAYSGDGAMVAAADSHLEALGPGCTTILYEAFETDKAIDHYETKMSASISQYYRSVIQDLSYVQNDVDKGAIFQVTNNGEEAARYVEGYALFFSGERLVERESTYFVDDDSEIKPGETVSKQMTAYEDFDRVEFYLTGWR